MPICNAIKLSFKTILLFVSLLSLGSSFAYAKDVSTDKIESSVRIGYVPQPAFRVDNGVASGVLADVFECSTAYFSNVEFVEISNYPQMMRVLESNVIDVALNMARSNSRDKVADYLMDVYHSRILLINDDASENNQGAGVLAVKQGSGIDALLLAKGYQVNTKTYSLDRLIEMYRKDLINSFAESEMVVLDALKSMDADDIDYDYETLAEFSAGVYIAKDFAKRYSTPIEKWKKVVQSCTYLAPKVDQ